MPGEMAMWASRGSQLGLLPPHRWKSTGATPSRGKHLTVWSCLCQPENGPLLLSGKSSTWKYCSPVLSKASNYHWCGHLHLWLQRGVEIKPVKGTEDLVKDRSNDLDPRSCFLPWGFGKDSAHLGYGSPYTQYREKCHTIVRIKIQYIAYKTK